MIYRLGIIFEFQKIEDPEGIMDILVVRVELQGLLEFNESRLDIIVIEIGNAYLIMIVGLLDFIFRGAARTGTEEQGYNTEKNESVRDETFFP